MNLLSASLVSAAVAVVYYSTSAPAPNIDIARTTAAVVIEAKGAVDAKVNIQPDADHWGLQLRRRLYDPPPKPKPKVVKRPRPINVTVVGTVIEPDNSQAFVRQKNRQVDIKRVGDQVTADPADGEVAEITAAGIVIRRDDGMFPVEVEGAN